MFEISRVDCLIIVYVNLEEDLPYTVDLQWLQQAWEHENLFQSKAVPAYIYKLSSRASAVRLFLLLFSFSIFSDRRSLKIENEDKSMNAEVSYMGS